MAHDELHHELFRVLFQEKRKKLKLSLREAASELDCSYSVIALFERTGKIGPHVFQKIQQWVCPDVALPPCQCYRCKDPSTLRHLEKSWAEIEKRINNLIDIKLKEHYDLYHSGKLDNPRWLVPSMRDIMK